MGEMGGDVKRSGAAPRAREMGRDGEIGGDVKRSRCTSGEGYGEIWGAGGSSGGTCLQHLEDALGKHILGELRDAKVLA